MQKIDFKNLPDTSTPFTAENFNQLQTNVENAISTSDIYSTEERVIGTWLGKPLYRKVIQHNGLQANATTNVATIENCETILVKEAYLISKNETRLSYPLNLIGYGGNTSDKVYIYSEQNTIKVYSNGGWSDTAWGLDIVVEYTKTTD